MLARQDNVLSRSNSALVYDSTKCTQVLVARYSEGFRGSDGNARAEEGNKSMRRQGSRVSWVAAKVDPPRKEEKKSGRGVGGFRDESRGRCRRPTPAGRIF